MELLLNLFWLLLALPAVWVWQQARCAQPGCRVHSRRSLLLIACVVLLLFPTVSASDDLQAMRPEVEESSSRDAQRHAQISRHSALADHTWTLATLPETAAVIPHLQCAGQAAEPLFEPYIAPNHLVRRGRAPPASFLG